MPNKKVKNSSKNSQSTISKYFISDSNYPTSSLMKRCANGFNNGSSPLKKIPKLQQETFENKFQHESNSSKRCSISDSVSEKLQTFVFQKVAKDEKFSSIYSSNEDFCNKNLNIDEKYLETEDSFHNEQPIGIDLNKDAVKTKADKSIKYTALEKQYLEFRNKYPDALLLMECGYKYRFFGKDAEIVSELCNIGCFKNHNFMSAIIPTQRLYFYVKQLVSKGYKVGVIKQAESAALKAAGQNKNELFVRKLDALYTKSTLIDPNELLDSFDVNDADSNPGYLLCICELPLTNAKGDAKLALVAVQISTGDFVYTSFEDSSLRNKLETYLFHFNPAEVLIPSNLSKEAENLISSFSSGRSVRIERFIQNVLDNSTALNHVTKFYTGNKSPQEACMTQDIQQMILTLPELVVSCLSALITYLSSFKLESTLRNLQNMKLLETDKTMVLSATTLKGLEIQRNNSNFSEHGSLFWVLNKTLTKFGERLLKLWITRPLKDINQIEERLNILTEIIYSESIVFKVVEKSLTKLPDLERILSCVFHHKCSCSDLLNLLQSFTKIKSEFLSINDKISSEIIVPRTKIILTELPELLDDVDRFLSNIDIEAARVGDKTKVFCNISMYPAMKKCLDEIKAVEEQLNDLRSDICKILKLINFKYATVAGQKYLIEVPNSNLRLVPNDWLKISSTKQVSRFRSPQIIKFCSQIDQQKELLIGHAADAWSAFLNDFGSQFYKYKRAISYLAELDCFFSLSKVAKVENYCRPHIINSIEPVFHIQQGRHPIITKIMGEENQFVANDLDMNALNRYMIVTGPNMGGKSTYIRQIALIAIMAHIGSYVPAESATIPLFDAIYVRMGSDDALAQGKSTFMIEMSETSEILSNATSRSLVILDELGRGTSTNDGTAVAYATLEYIISEIKCFTLFVTHYPPVVELEKHYPENISVVHMGYILKDNESDDSNGIETVIFLYNVVSGISKKSYGINVAALAGIPKDVLFEAQKVSQLTELRSIIKRKIKSLMQKLKPTLSNC
ncbi:DNA mismatch repair protein Msh3 like protein [Argiope bruennichi]|uniref:DNA mismatch repair protein MSH3 n=1 Tax=Argiope bruennichi TaxID=94029 RepID=A0A8T0FYZ6_ARGBR|nr:DNA mismatch repair protein Msh3 like protein [Argiope bruennichi]